MSELKMTEPALNCPTSGPILRAAIRAFGIRNGGTLAADNTLVGNLDSQRSERRYLTGEDPVPEEVRGRVTARLADALINSGLITDRILPTNSKHGSLRDAITAGIAHWAATWDAVYRQGSQGWPYLPRSLAGFVLGREAVMDLVLRVSALMYLADANPTPIVIHAARDHGGRAILEHAMSLADRTCGYQSVARAAAVDPRTAQRWLNESEVPDDEHIACLASSLGGKDSARAASLLRYLRIQFGLMRVINELAELIGPVRTRNLAEGLERLLNRAVAINGDIRQSPESFHSTLEGLELAQCELLVMGSMSEIATALYPLWVTPSEPALWGYELWLASQQPLDKRLDRVWRTIGDWPTYWRNNAFVTDIQNLSPAEYQTRLENVALVSLCPPLREEVRRQGASVPEVGIPREVEEMIYRACDLVEVENPEASLPLWTEITSRLPDAHDNFRMFGVALRKAKRPNDAMEQFRRATALAPNDPASHIEIARTYMALGRNDDALHYLEQLPQAVRDRSAEALWVAADLYFRFGRYKECCGAMSESLKLDPEHAGGHELLALALLRMPRSRENREAAARHAKKAAAAGRTRALEELRATTRDRRE